MMGVAVGLLPLVLLVGGMPIFIVLLLAATVGILAQGNIPLQAVHTAIFGSLDNVPLLAIPLFVLAGDFMAKGGIARRLIEFVLTLIGGVRGSLGIATIASASIFGAMSGSSVACVAAIGKLTLPSLEKHGYGRTYSVSLITATGVIDIIIPPSIPMIIYGIAAQQSIPDLFLAGIVPGLIVAIALSALVVARAKIVRVPIVSSGTWAEVGVKGRQAVWAMLAPVVILAGIYGGIFTPTEAAGVACIYAIVVSVYVHRELTWPQVWTIVVQSSLLVGQVMIIVAAAGAYSWLVTSTGIPAQLVDMIDGLRLETWALLLLINAILLLVGSVLEPPAAILVLTPLLTPLVYKAGVDPMHFGMIITVNLAIGLFMPPFGLNLFTSHALFGTPLAQLYRGVLPFLVLYLMILALITYVPAITLVPLALMK